MSAVEITQNRTHAALSDRFSVVIQETCVLREAGTACGPADDWRMPKQYLP